MKFACKRQTIQSNEQKRHNIKQSKKQQWMKKKKVTAYILLQHERYIRDTQIQTLMFVYLTGLIEINIRKRTANKRV